MEIPASLLVSQLKAQRNAALDEVAMAVAQCHHLMEENAKLKELSDKQQGLLAEADKLMKAMAKQNSAPRRRVVKMDYDASTKTATLNGEATANISAAPGRPEDFSPQ